jgi:polyisoprenyl-teichoic acid--peptidoglycan teichoic acid transferase
MRRRQTPKIVLPKSIDRLTAILVVAFLLLASTTGVVAYFVVRNLVSGWSLTQIPNSPMDSSVPVQDTTPGVSNTLQPLTQAGPTPMPWDGASRVNVLIMGLDYRDYVAGDVPRTDTMMLLTIDPVTRTAGMLSIPRDMWVEIPNFNYAKINTAYFLGETYKLPGGGPGLAVQTVEQFLGVPINFYAQVDFAAFEKFIDEIGGIVLDIKEEIVIVPIGQPDKVTLQVGKQRVNGAIALAYARNRYTAGGDFDRAGRQQEVIMGIREQVMKAKVLPMLIANAPSIYANLSAGIRTNLSLDDVIKLAWLAQQVPPANIKKAVIGTDAVTFGKSPDGLDILKPIPDKIRLIRDTIFTTGGPVGPAAVAEDPIKLMKAEGAKVIVKNGTSVSGLANQTSDYLKAQGVNVINTANADQVYNNSMVYDYSGKPYTLRYLVDLMKIPGADIFSSFDPSNQADVVIIVGQDWANQNPMK